MATSARAQWTGCVSAGTQKEIAKRSCTHALDATSGAPTSSESNAIIISTIIYSGCRPRVAA